MNALLLERNFLLNFIKAVVSSASIPTLHDLIRGGGDKHAYGKQTPSFGGGCGGQKKSITSSVIKDYN